MSTRAQIAFYEKADSPISSANTFVYKHLDGYPEGVLPLLVAFCRAFQMRRGLDDTSYASARYISALCEQDRQTSQAGRAQGGSLFFYEQLDCLGIGVDAALHEDIDFFYHVSPTQIKVYACSGEQSPERWKLVRTMALPPGR